MLRQKRGRAYQRTPSKESESVCIPGRGSGSRSGGGIGRVIAQQFVESGDGDVNQDRDRSSGLGAQFQKLFHVGAREATPRPAIALAFTIEFARHVDRLRNEGSRWW